MEPHLDKSTISMVSQVQNRIPTTKYAVWANANFIVIKNYTNTPKPQYNHQHMLSRVVNNQPQRNAHNKTIPFLKTIKWRATYRKSMFCCHQKMTQSSRISHLIINYVVEYPICTDLLYVHQYYISCQIEVLEHPHSGICCTTFMVRKMIVNPQWQWWRRVHKPNYISWPPQSNLQIRYMYLALTRIDTKVNQILENRWECDRFNSMPNLKMLL